MKSAKLNVLAASALVVLAGWFGASAAIAEPPEKDKPAEKAQEAPKATEDTIIFRNGNILKGKITSETATSVHFKGFIAGIAAETDYSLSDILEIKKADAVASAVSEPKSVADVRTPVKAPLAVDDGVAKQRVYWLDLDGKFGEEISQTPIRKAVRDAWTNQADVIIVMINSQRPDPRAGGGDDAKELTDDIGEFDEIWRAEKMLPIFVDEMPVEWDGKQGHPKMPRIVFWVKRAMGGACFLPMFCKEIYFDPDGKMGGIGNLSYMMHGNERVVNKQKSLRLQHAVGWALVGGYPEEIVRAMASIEYVLSVRYVNGKPEFFEGYPTNPGEELLTDDGKDERADSIEALARDEGNDVLTLTAPLAKKLLISKGTVSTKEELLGQLGLDRTGMLIPGHSDQIMKDWSKGLETAKTQIKTILADMSSIKVQAPGGFDERTKARSQQLHKLGDLKQILIKWGEGLDPYWLARHGIRLNQQGEPDISAITTTEEKIKIDQLKDRKK